MPLRRVVFLLIIFPLLLVGCGAVKKGEAAKEEQPFGPTGIPPQLRARGGTDGGTVVAAGGNVAPIAITPEEELVFTDPDNPDGGLPELETLLAAPKRGPWEESETIARQTAAREGKPILIWFTDSARSPMCKALTQELFLNPEFEQWAAENLVRLRVDSNTAVTDPKLSMDEKTNRQIALRNYVDRLKKRYRILGHPNMLMLNPSGEVIARYRGYRRGDANYTWGLMRQGVASSAAAYDSWRRDLESKGYREWQDRRGRKVFARLVHYSEGTLIMVEPGGVRYKTTEKKLSDGDRKWIDQQKSLRGIQ